MARENYFALMNSERVKIVSFSGIDGGGKSTQIAALTHAVLASGLRVRIFTFWDDVVILSRLREKLSHKAFKGDQGIGSPERPLNRRDKNVSSLPVTATRLFLYFLDALSVWRKVRQAKKGDADVVIFDRYIYDELANLPLHRRWMRVYVRLLLGFIPAPDPAFVIDADPVAARARKPEYPLEFLQKNREAYITLSHLARNITVIEPLPVAAAELRIRRMFPQNLSGLQEQLSGLPAVQ